MGHKYGDGSTDYEKYVRSKELYELIREPSTWQNEDEPLFQVTHMAMELWLSVTIQHLDQVIHWLDEDNVTDATRFLNRAANIVNMLIDSLRHIETMAPWKYHAIRVTLGKGSGQQSPTFTHLLELPKDVLNAYEVTIERHGTTVDDIQQNPDAHGELYALTAAMLLFDENFMRWRFAHFQLVKRIIGDKVMSLKGIPASALKAHAFEASFPDLWESISRTTIAYNEEHGAPGDSGGYQIPKA